MLYVVLPHTVSLIRLRLDKWEVWSIVLERWVTSLFLQLLIVFGLDDFKYPIYQADHLYVIA